jgi:biopolymer transport protein ExbD
VFWNSEPIDQAQMLTRIGDASKATPQPELHLRADRQTPYEKVAQVMAAAQSGGLTKMGFVTEVPTR